MKILLFLMTMMLWPSSLPVKEEAMLCHWKLNVLFDRTGEPPVVMKEC